MAERRTTMYEEIETLLAAPAAGDGAPELAHVEDALTTGYARALLLETERLRTSRRIVEVTEHGDPHEELGLLNERLGIAAEELTRLRNLLHPLKVRASELRLRRAEV